MKYLHVLPFLATMLMCLNPLGAASQGDVSLLAVPDALLILADSPEERKLLSDIFEQVAKFPKEQQRAKGYELIKSNINKFQSAKLTDRLYLFLVETSIEMGKAEDAKQFTSKISSDTSSFSIPNETILIRQYFVTKQYDKVIERISEILTVYDKEILGSIRAEFEVQLLLASVLAKKTVDIRAECQRILGRQDEARKKLLQRLHRFAVKLNDTDCITVMEWLKTETTDEDGLALLNNLSFAYGKIGDREKSTEARQELIKKYPNDPRVVDQIGILASEFEHKKIPTGFPSPEGRAEARKLHQMIAEHPLATEEQKKRGQLNVERLDRIEHGQPTSDLNPDTFVPVQNLINPASRTLVYVRITILICGFVLIVIALILLWLKK